MIFILFTMSCVAANGLKVTFLNRTDPHVDPRWRNRERPYSRQYCRIADQASIWIEVREALTRTDTPYAWRTVRDIQESGDLGRCDGVRCRQSHMNFYGTSKASRDTFVRTGEVWKHF